MPEQWMSFWSWFFFMMYLLPAAFVVACIIRIYKGD